MTTTSPLRRTLDLGISFWNDSCDLAELEHAVRIGAVGATVLSYRPSDSEDGYFLLLASPQVKAADAKPCGG